MKHSEEFDNRGRRSLRRAPNSPRRTRISKEPEERRQEIIETALELLAEKGYDNTNVQDITDRMNVSPGLCYRYFKSKTEIFAAASELYASKAIKQIKVPNSADTPVIEKLQIFIKRIFDFSMSHQQFESRYHEETDIRAIHLDHVADQWYTLLLPIIDQGTNEGIFHCKDIPATTHFLIYGLVHTFHKRIPAAKDTSAYMENFLLFIYDMFARVLEFPVSSFGKL